MRAYERAAEMIFTGRIIDAQEAQEIGMVFKVVEPASLMQESYELARKIAAKPAPLLCRAQFRPTSRRRIALWCWPGDRRPIRAE
jgi:enoyl-CoA hydratase/carnithine racemase